MTREETLEAIIVDLWEILDDIDSYDDMAKDDDKLYRSLVSTRQTNRFLTEVETDGYRLNIAGKWVEVEE